MAEFQYQLREASGNVVHGRITAGTLGEAAALLRSHGGFLLDVAPAVAKKSFLDLLKACNIQPGPGPRDVMNFTSQLAVMIKAGINIRAAVAGIAEQIENPTFQRIVEEIREDVEAGKPFSEALARHPKVFPPLYINMVRASEMSGSFGHMLDRICAYLRQQIETRSMVRGAMVYPIIIGVTAIGTTIFLLTFVLPRFSALFAGKEAMLPLPTKILLNLSNFMINYWYAIVLAAAVGLGGFILFIRSPVGQLWWDGFKLKVPLLKKMFRAMYLTRGLQTMGEMVNAGVPMLDALSITAQVSGNSHYRNMWMTVHNAVKGGKKIADPLAKYGLLPKNVVQMVSAGEESGKLGEVLHDVADFYANELRNTIKTVTAMIEPLMIVMMGGVVGFIAMSIILPIFKMSSLVK